MASTTKKSFLLFYLLSATLLACNDNNRQTSRAYYHPNPAGVFDLISSSGNLTLNPKHGQPGHRCDISEGSPLPQSLQPVTSPAGPTALNTTSNALPLPTLSTNASVPPTVATDLNPAHGQPGHRCDLAVGAPLNSAPASPTVTTPKLNPEHGQPGHRCELAVGAPLTSTPPKPETNVPSTTAIQNKSATPPQNNPAHGQPGHRCDIAVGAPLNSSASAKTTASDSTKVAKRDTVQSSVAQKDSLKNN